MTENDKMTDVMINTIKNKVLSMLDEDARELITLLNEIKNGKPGQNKTREDVLTNEKNSTGIKRVDKDNGSFGEQK